MPDLHRPYTLTYSLNVHIFQIQRIQSIQHTHTHTHTHSHIPGQWGNIQVFKEDFKELTEVEWQTETGGWFHIAGAWSEKERWPLDFVWKDGILNTQVSTEEWSCWEGVWHNAAQIWFIYQVLAKKQNSSEQWLAVCQPPRILLPDRTFQRQYCIK